MELARKTPNAEAEFLSVTQRARPYVTRIMVGISVCKARSESRSDVSSPPSALVARVGLAAGGSRAGNFDGRRGCRRRVAGKAECESNGRQASRYLSKASIDFWK